MGKGFFRMPEIEQGVSIGKVQQLQPEFTDFFVNKLFLCLGVPHHKTFSLKTDPFLKPNYKLHKISRYISAYLYIFKSIIGLYGQSPIACVNFLGGFSVAVPRNHTP
jgi:hypothetical protein